MEGQVLCYSQAKQDLFVAAMHQGKQNGTWLEIGCYQPEFINNTMMLEKYFGWKGVSIDKGIGLTEHWKNKRPNSDFRNLDVFELDWNTVPNFFDYVQIDIDPVEHNLQILETLLENRKFATLTFEHDFFSGSEQSSLVREKSRNLLSQYGFEMIANDVTILPDDGRSCNNNPMWFEDWWAHPDFIDNSIIDLYKFVTTDLEPKYWNHILYA